MRLRTRGTHALVATLAAGVMALSACGGSSDGGGEAGGSQGDGDTNASLAELKKEGTIVVGIAGEKPYSYMEDGKPTGATIAMHEEIFKNLGIKNVEAKMVDWDALIPGLNAGRFDAISAGMSILPDRCKQAAFSVPEIMYTTAFAVPKGNPDDLHDMQDIKSSDARLAVINGAVESNYADALGIDATTVDNAEDGYKAVQDGRADVFALTGISVRTWVKDHPDSGLEATDSFEAVVDGKVQVGAGATVFRKGDDELRKAYNKESKKITGSKEKWAEILGPFGFTEAERPTDAVTTDMLCKGDLPSVDEYQSKH